MVWLASFPRSGNTFFRNVLYEVYGIESSTFHMEENYYLDPEYHTYPVIKTHLLPDQLIPNDPKIPKVYLVRDGRDALVSIAHHRKDIIEPGTDFKVNLLEAILASGGSYFGGWSENVRRWLAVADVVIRFEDLINDPIREIEKLRPILDLPNPDVSKLPTFEKLKFGKPKYGAGTQYQHQHLSPEALAKVNFRKGSAGSYKEEMPPEYLELFYELHGDVLFELGYDSPKTSAKTYKILIEAAKADEASMDGIGRYCTELLRGLQHINSEKKSPWVMDVLIGKSIMPIKDFLKALAQKQETESYKEGVTKMSAELPYETKLLKFKNTLALLLPGAMYRIIKEIYLLMPIRPILRWYKQFRVLSEIKKFRRGIEKHYDLVHIPLPQNFHHVRKLKSKMVFTVHDLTHKTHPQFHLKENIALAEKGMKFIQNTQSGIIAVSQATYSDLKATYDLKSQKCQVIYEAGNHDIFRTIGQGDYGHHILRKYNLEPKRYFLCVFTLEPRKNLKNLILGFLHYRSRLEDSGLKLVVTGGKGWKAEFLDEIDWPSDGSVVRTGYVQDEDLAWLYSHAYAFCYIPFREGFGLPALEALQLGIPVICSETSSLPEVCGDAALYADPNDPAQIGQKMLLLVSDKVLYSELCQRSFAQSRKFSWLKTAFETMNFYQKMIER